MPSSHEFEIQFDSATNKLKYEHKKNGTVVPAAGFGHVDPGDTVIWFSKAEKFAVHFKENHSPFDSGEPVLTAAKSSSTVKRPTSTETVRAHPITTTYRYFVASAKAGGAKHILTEDPELIVDGTGGGGGGTPPKGGGKKGKKGKKHK